MRGGFAAGINPFKKSGESDKNLFLAREFNNPFTYYFAYCDDLLGDKELIAQLRCGFRCCKPNILA